MPPYYFLSQVRDGFTNAKIGGVNVYLMNEDSVVLDSCKSNSSGSFSIKVRREWKLKSCIIKITSPGYRTHYSSHSLRYVGKTQFHRVPDLFMKKRNTLTERTLDELTVKATKVKMYYKGDTLVYNADAFNLASGSMLDDLIRQMPGVELTRQGEVFVNGRKVENLLLNGKDFFKGNHHIMLENLPYYTVKNIKVYEQTTVKADSIAEEEMKHCFVEWEEQAKFQEGEQWSPQNYIYQNLKYYARLLDEQQKTKGVYKIRIDSYGEIKEAKTIRSCGISQWDEEVERIIRNMPRWTPTIYHRGKVRYKGAVLTIPVVFTLRLPTRQPSGLSCSAASPDCGIAMFPH